MNSNNKKINISNLLFYISYFLLVVQSMTRWVHLEIIPSFSTVCNIIIPLLLLLVFILKNNKINKKVFLVILLLTILTITSMFITNGNAIWNIVLFLITSKNINLDKLIKFDLIIKTIVIIIIFILYKNGLTDDIVIYRNSVRRYGLGFGHPNTFSVYLMSICLDLLYISFKTKYKRISYLIIIFSILFISKYCDSRSAIFTLLLTLILSISISLIKNKKILMNITSKLPYLFMIASFVATILYKYKNYFPFIESLNALLSNRILLMYQFYEEYSITLLGNRFIDYHTQATSTASVLDNAYILLLTKFGIIISLIIVIALSKRIKKAYSEENIGLIVCLLSFSFFGLMENGMIVLFYNPFLLFISHLIYSYKKKGEINENT